jgi:hypothetical protein
MECSVADEVDYFAGSSGKIITRLDTRRKRIILPVRPAKYERDK